VMQRFMPENWKLRFSTSGTAAAELAIVVCDIARDGQLPVDADGVSSTPWAVMGRHRVSICSADRRMTWVSGARTRRM
jgi:hypothetical protein